MKRRRKQIVLFVGMFMLVNIFFFSIAYPRWRDYERLAHAGVHTQGRVTATEPGNHNAVVYEYFVASNVYTGRSSASFGGLPPLSQISVGNAIPITYLPGFPSVSVPGDPAELYGSWSFLLFVGAPIFGVIAGAVTVWRSNRTCQNVNAVNV